MENCLISSRCVLCVLCVLGVAMDTSELEELYDYVYAQFLEEIDAVDNGISDRDGQPRY